MSDGSVPARLEALARQYARLVRAAVVRVGGPRGADLADDVEQQVFLSLWRQVEREQTIHDPASYIYKSAVRETVRLLRAEARRGDEPLDDAVLDRAGNGPAPDRQLDATRTRAAIVEALGTLSPDRQRAVRAHLSGYPVAEVMDMYGWTYQRARNLIARGLADLRAALRARGIDG